MNELGQSGQYISVYNSKMGNYGKHLAYKVSYILRKLVGLEVTHAHTVVTYYD